LKIEIDANNSLSVEYEAEIQLVIHPSSRIVSHLKDKKLLSGKTVGSW
jgi:hypothetical protein